MKRIAMLIPLMLMTAGCPVWTPDPRTALPSGLQGLRVERCTVLGATAPWLDRDGDFSSVGVHTLADGARVVQSAEALVARLAELVGAGMSTRTAFLVLQAFTHGHVTHLLRANYEGTGWARQFDDVVVRGLESLIKGSLDEGRRTQAFLRLADGGLGLSSAEQSAEAAYLGSWALTLKDVAACVGAASWESFQAKCAPLARSLAEAEAKLLHDAGGAIQPVDWVGLFSEPRRKLQSFWFAKLREHRKEALLRGLDTDGRVDLRSVGGPGAGGFLEPPVPFEDQQPKHMPDQHFQLSLRCRLCLPVCPPGATCQHRRADGSVCGQPLDPHGRHALKCEVGRARLARHNALRDFTAAFHSKVSGFVTAIEQRVVAWDRVNQRTGLLEEARLDVATRDAVSGRKIFVDAMVTCANCGYEPRQRARANKDGVAATDAVRAKRLRYPPAGGELVPLVFEAGGRPAEETVAFVRSWCVGLESAERSAVIRFAWQQYSVVLQSGNAEMILSALG